MNKQKKFDDLRAMLRIDKSRLDDELIEHPELLVQVGLERSSAMSLRDGLKAQLKKVEGSLWVRLIEEADKKPTDKVLAALLLEDPQREDIAGRLAGVEDELRVWEDLLEGFRARSFALHNLTAIATSENVSLNNHSASKKEDRAGRNRKGTRLEPRRKRERL